MLCISTSWEEHSVWMLRMCFHGRSFFWYCHGIYIEPDDARMHAWNCGEGGLGPYGIGMGMGGSCCMMVLSIYLLFFCFVFDFNVYIYIYIDLQFVLI